jgi:hypothetical protein
MMEARLAKPEEAELAVDWLNQTPENMFDKMVLTYKSTLTLCVANGEPMLFMPLQICIFMDALGKKPGIRKRDMAHALIEMIAATKRFAKGSQISEVFFFCKERTVSAAAPHFGFEVICEDEKRGITLFRMKADESSQ